jgi:translocation and assembly module TamB
MKRAMVALCVLVLVLVLTLPFLVSTQWFRDRVREKIVSYTESATGGKVDLGSFRFDGTGMRATITDFVIHGTEDPGQAPLLRTRRAEMVLKLFPSFRHAYELDSLDVDSPQVHLIVYPDGHTNVPSPKIKPPNNTTVLQDLVDLAIHKFDIRNGALNFANRKINFSAHGENLVTQLSFDTLKQSYDGQISVNPLVVQNTPLDVLLPVHLERDKAQLTQARIATPQSEITGSASLQHLTDPKIAANLSARLSLVDLNQIAGLKLDLRAKNVPRQLLADLILADNKIAGANLRLGDSTLQASGQNAGLRVAAKLSLPQLAQLFTQPSLAAAGTADLSSMLISAPNQLRADDLRLSVLGGTFAGIGSLTDLRRYSLAGDLKGFDIKKLAPDLGYTGLISGQLAADGDVYKVGRSFVAKANLTIQPSASKGVPVSGKLNLDSNGTVANSYLVLPNSRLDVSGSLNHELQIKLVSHDLADFRPIAGGESIPVKFVSGGAATFEGTVTGSIADPRITGRISAKHFTLEDRPFDELSAGVSVSSSHAAIQDGSLARGALAAQFTAEVGLRRWKPESTEALTAAVQLRNADIADVLAFAGEKDVSLTGAINADAHISGTIGNPQGLATLTVVNGTASGYKFDRLSATLTLADVLVTLSNSQLIAGTAQINATGTYRHPRDSFSTGHFDVKVGSNPMPLDQFRKQNTAGSVQVNANIAGDSLASGLQITSINGNVEGRALRYEGETLGDLHATANTAGNAVNFSLNAAPFGSAVHVTGQTRFTKDYPSTADLKIASLPMERVAALAGREDLPIAGKLTADAKLSGTLSDPNATATFSLSNGTLYEHVDNVQGQIAYAKNELQVESFNVSSGSARLSLSGSYTHPPETFQQGQVRFTVKSNDMQLAQFKKLQELRPGLAGILKLDATGEGRVQKAEPPLLLTTLNANLAANGLSINKQPVGNAALTAQTQGQDLTFKLQSDFAHADISSSGTVQLRGDYQTKADLSFKSLTYAGLRPWLPLTNMQIASTDLDGVMEGSASISGPALKPEELTAKLQIPKLQLAASPRPGLSTKMSRLTLQNEGPIVLTLNRSVVRIESAHIVGPHTNLNLAGTATFQPKQALDIQADGTLDVGVLQSLDRDLYSSGSVTLQAKITGPLDDPSLNGQLQLKSASMNLIDVPNGVSNANGTVIFNGKSAVIQSLTAESGGGSITVGGNATYKAGNATFRLTANAKNVRVRYPESVSTLADAAITLNGNFDRSVLSGTVTVQRIGFNPHSDFGSILSAAAPPIQAPSSPNSLLSSVHLQIQVRTSPGIQFQSALAQNVEATANLRVRGTLDEPDVLGRIDITQGELVFFGAKYTVNQGSIAFYDPTKITPVLNVDLETNLQGVDIILTISGPADNLKLTHRSDPPLPFDQVLSLLAAGRTPTDPTIAARQPLAPPQSVEDVGESALLSQVVASPITDRLSRVFGITELKIAPAFVTGSVLPQARVTLSQQVARNVNFTYITDVSHSDVQIFQVEWSISDKWSAVATRDESGLFGIDFYYKRKFK